MAANNDDRARKSKWSVLLYIHIYCTTISVCDVWYTFILHSYMCNLYINKNAIFFCTSISYIQSNMSTTHQHKYTLQSQQGWQIIRLCCCMSDNTYTGMSTRSATRALTFIRYTHTSTQTQLEAAFKPVRCHNTRNHFIYIRLLWLLSSFCTHVYIFGVSCPVPFYAFMLSVNIRSIWISVCWWIRNIHMRVCFVPTKQHTHTHSNIHMGDSKTKKRKKNTHTLFISVQFVFRCCFRVVGKRARKIYQIKASR